MQPNSYYPEGPNDITGGLPINLDSLRDGPPGSKPFYPYSTLIRYAIKGSPNQKLLLEDIYYAIESRNSVRHNLSLNPCFEKVARPLTDRGKGSYWTVNDNVDPRTGVHRVRKKKPKGSRGRGNPQQIIEDHDIDEYIPPDGQAPPPFDDPNAQYVQPSLDPNAAGPSKIPYPPPYPFDPTFPMMPPPQGIRFPPPPMPTLPEDLQVDEQGNVDWHLAWIKELQQLQNLTTEQQKAGADQEWYRMMLFRVRSAMMVPALPPGELGGPPPPMPTPNPGDVSPEDHEPA
ncbi:hypothetical protein EWM64_g50 [Hericium alpestre]|uniref:Fork-head domain-containing protein n=1 Tax=Hericium alpestre TaxID=135208 RepID=A0A4Z0AA03_9AGAM|nr:hypothetical protein EWM64_g50 [Hericium alpestre]